LNDAIFFSASISGKDVILCKPKGHIEYEYVNLISKYLNKGNGMFVYSPSKHIGIDLSVTNSFYFYIDSLYSIEFYIHSKYVSFYVS